MATTKPLKATPLYSNNMQLNKHILLTLFHFLRKANNFGAQSLTREEGRLYKQCYRALEDDHISRMEELQRCKPYLPRIDVSHLPTVFLNSPSSHPLCRVPTLVCIFLTPAGEPEQVTSFSLN